MAVSARSWVTMLVLALGLSLGPATGATAQACEPDGDRGGPLPAPPAPTIPLPSFPGPSVVVPGTPPPVIVTLPPLPRASAAAMATAAGNPPPPCDDLVVPFRADTGAGGLSDDASPTTGLLLSGGVLALGAAFGVRRAARRRQT